MVRLGIPQFNVPVVDRSLGDFVGVFHQARRVAEFKALLKGLLPGTRALEGCQQVDQGHEIGGEIYPVEAWASKEHQERYRAWRAETGIADTLRPFMAGEPRFNYFNKLDV